MELNEKQHCLFLSFDSLGNSNKKYPPSITSLPSDMNGLSTRMNGLSTRSTTIDPSKAGENETQTQSKIFCHKFIPQNRILLTHHIFF